MNEQESNLWNIVVVKFVVAERDVNVECEVVAIVKQDALVDVDRLLVVTSQVVNGRQRQLILDDVTQVLVESHEALLVVEFVWQVEHEAVLQRCFRS